MRACYLEHADTARFLCERDPTALRIKNFTGQTCMDLTSQSLNPLIANLLEKKYLETFSDELQTKNTKLGNSRNKMFRNVLPTTHSPFENNRIRMVQNESFFSKNDENDGNQSCKDQFNSDNMLIRYIIHYDLPIVLPCSKTLLCICTYINSLKFIQTSFINSNTWRAKSLDGHDRSSSSSSINSNPAKHGYHQPTNNCKTNLRDLQKPLTIHVDYQLPGSVSSGPRSHRTISSAHTNTSLSNGARDTCASLHVPSSNVIKSNIICPHGQRRLSKR